MPARQKAKPAAASLHQWRISRLKSTPAITLGMVEAADAEGAIKAAVEKFGITDPWQQSRLVAQRIVMASR
jgi:hypothetical protein